MQEMLENVSVDLPLSHRKQEVLRDVLSTLSRPLRIEDQLMSALGNLGGFSGDALVY